MTYSISFWTLHSIVHPQPASNLFFFGRRFFPFLKASGLAFGGGGRCWKPPSSIHSPLLQYLPSIVCFSLSTIFCHFFSVWWSKLIAFSSTWMLSRQLGYFSWRSDEAEIDKGWLFWQIWPLSTRILMKGGRIWGVEEEKWCYWIREWGSSVLSFSDAGSSRRSSSVHSRWNLWSVFCLRSVVRMPIFCVVTRSNKRGTNFQLEELETARRELILGQLYASNMVLVLTSNCWRQIRVGNINLRSCIGLLSERERLCLSKGQDTNEDKLHCRSPVDRESPGQVWRDHLHVAGCFVLLMVDVSFLF